MLSSQLTEDNTKKRRENVEKSNRKNLWIDYITKACTIFKSVCNSEGNKAFDLAVAYLQMRKGTKGKKP